MDSHIDESLINKYLMASPPLHPRRTLDQSYYWTLKDTRKRDRDQTVYRETAPNPLFLHHACLKGTRAEENVKENCPQCLEDVRKIPRCIMVDQLWLWALDESEQSSRRVLGLIWLIVIDTVITSFPRKWGRRTKDSSDVEKRIRNRLRAATDDEVNSVVDLVIIIIDQCSRIY